MKKYLLGSLIVAVIIAASIVVTRSAPVGRKYKTYVQATATPVVQSRTLNMSEVSNHFQTSNCWSVIDGNVYDLSRYINQHPGGRMINQACGVDASSLFAGQGGMGHMHSQMAKQILNKYILGKLVS